jgi:hypothetical protein
MQAHAFLLTGHGRGFDHNDHNESNRHDTVVEIDVVSIFNLHVQLLNQEQVHAPQGLTADGWPPPTRYVRRPRDVTESAPSGPKSAVLDPDLSTAGPPLVDFDGLMLFLER